MEHQSFDNLARTLSETSTRRRFGGFLTALGLGTVAGLGLLGATEMEARKRHKRRRNKHKNRDKGNDNGNGDGSGNGGGTDPEYSFRGFATHLCCSASSGVRKAL